MYVGYCNCAFLSRHCSFLISSFGAPRMLSGLRDCGLSWVTVFIFWHSFRLDRVFTRHNMYLHYCEWMLQGQNVSSGICEQRRPRSACASSQSDQGLRCPLTESLDNIKCMNAEQIPLYAHAESVHSEHARRYIFAWGGPYRNHTLHMQSGIDWSCTSTTHYVKTTMMNECF